jgi:hypothetical protein
MFILAGWFGESGVDTKEILPNFASDCWGHCKGSMRTVGVLQFLLPKLCDLDTIQCDPTEMNGG